MFAYAFIYKRLCMNFPCVFGQMFGRDGFVCGIDSIDVICKLCQCKIQFVTFQLTFD